MEIQTKEQGLRAKVGRTELIVEHKGKDLTFIDPPQGPNTYFIVAEALDKEGLKKPTMAENASLVYSAWQNPDNAYSKKIIDILKSNWLWGFNGILYIPKEGAYIEDCPSIKDGRVVMDKSGLVKRLESKDSSVRFVKFGFETDGQTSSKFAKNRFVIGLAEEEGAEKLAKVAEKYRYSPYVFSFKNVDSEIIRVSALDSDYYDYRLRVLGDRYVDYRYGFAFGVL